MPNTAQLNRALRYASQGWKLFPCRWHQNKKQHMPIVRWGEFATSDHDTIRSWANLYQDCYFCVALQKSDLTIIDIDNKKGVNGSNTLFDLELNNAPLPDTLTITTPSKGFHYYFNGKSPVTVSRLGKGIDTPVMAPIPGSVVKGKGTYKISKDLEIDQLPQWFSDLFGVTAAKPIITKAVVELDQPENIERATDYLAFKADIAEMGASGDHTTYKTACKVRDLGISQDRCLELMLENWNERCEPPWKPDELQNKVRNAYRYSQNSAGVKTVEAIFADGSAAPAEKDEKPRYNIRKLSDFQGEPPLREWIIEGFLPRGEVSALYGDGGLGKSYLSLQLGLNTASGQGTFLDFPVLKQMPTLVVACEDSVHEIHRRINGIRKSSEYTFLDNSAPFYALSMVGDNPIIAYQEGAKILLGKFFKPLRNMVRDIGQGGDMLLILDTASDIFAINENDRQMASHCIKTILSSFVRDLNCTILVLAHPSKTSQRTGIYDSGSSGWRNSFRNMWAIYSHPNKHLADKRYLKQMKSNYSRLEEPLLLSWEEGRLVRGEEKGLVDTIKEQNTEIMMDFISTQCTKKPMGPIGAHKLSKPSIYSVDIQNAAGGFMPDKMKTKIINELMVANIVVEVKKAGRFNGLWLVSDLPERLKEHTPEGEAPNFY